MTTQLNEDRTSRATLELLYNISRELATALDLRTLLQRVLLLSMRYVGATTGSLIVLDDQGQPVESSLVIGAQIIENTTQQLRPILESGLAGWVVRNLQSVLIPDTSQDERWMRRPDDDRTRTGAKSAASVPLLLRERLVGVMTLVHPTPGTFTLDHLALLQAIADQSAIAVLNARLFDETQRRARVMTAVAESAEAITAALGTEDVLHGILAQISNALRVEVVALALLDPRQPVLEFQAATAGQGFSLIGRRIAVGDGVSGWVAREDKGLICTANANDPRFTFEFSGLKDFNATSLACAPIRSEGKVIGVMQAFNPADGAFDAGDLLFLTSIGSLAGAAIRHAQLFERLEAAHQRYRELFDDSIDPIIITDFQGLVFEANRQASLMSGYEKKSLLHQQISQLHAVDYGQVGEGFAQISQDETLSYDSNLITKSGQPVAVKVYVRVVQIEDLVHLQWILRDISEHKKLESLRDDLISMIYHDLRSPLANVVSSLDVLAATLPVESDPAFKSLLNIAVRSTERIQRLTNSLLDINRLEAGQPIGSRQAVHPADITGDAVEAVLPVTINKKQHLESTVSKDLPAVLADPDMIRRVLTNLLENAVKYTPPDGKISVGAEQQGDFVSMWVSDTGTGIQPADQERIFDKYSYRQTAGGPKGIGLGLAYCRLAIEGHNGKIWVESQPGAGSKFIFTLPIA